MKIVKGYRLYNIKENRENREKDDNCKLVFTEHLNLYDLNRELEKLGYKLVIKGFLKPYKFYNLNNGRKYSYSELFNGVPDEFFVYHSYIVVDATDEEKKRLEASHVQISLSNLFNECSAALIYHGVGWVYFEEHRESIYSGRMYTLNRETGIETEKNIVDPKYELKDLIFNVKKVEYIY